MAARLVKHGTWAGYKVELDNDNVCDRCRAASRVYNSQYTKANRAKGIKYGTNEVIDHLYRPGRNQSNRVPVQTRPVVQGSEEALDHAASTAPDATLAGPQTDAESQDGPSLADRLRGILGSQRPVDGYVETDAPPDYISAIDPDPEPQGDNWARPADDDFVVTAEGMRAIKDNLGTYAATVGMTLGLIDPYCGAAIRDNLDDMVDAWSRVISHYPSAARMFMQKGGGKIMAWIDALMSTWPVLVAVYEHHLSKTVQINSLGQPVRVTKDDRENLNGHFATQPQYDYRVD